MKKIIFIIIFLSCFNNHLFSQSVFSLDPKKDLTIGALSLGIGVTPFFLNNDPKMPDTLDKDELNIFDRFFMSSYKKTLDLVSDNSAYVLAVLPIVSLIPNITNRNTILTYSIMYSQALLFTYGTVFTLKRAINRYRPYMYKYGVPSGKENDYHNSFPSSAAAFSFLGATFLSVTFSKEFPDSKWKLPIIFGSHFLATGLASMRVYSNAHFFTDALAGALVGSLYGGIIPFLHLSNNKKITLLPNINGITILLRF